MKKFICFVSQKPKDQKGKSYALHKPSKAKCLNPLKQINHMHELRLNKDTLDVQIAKRTDAMVLKFDGEQRTKEDYLENWQKSDLDIDKTLKKLGKTLKSSKKIRRLEIQFQGLITDENLTMFVSNLKQLSSLQSISLNFKRNSKITDQGLKIVKQGLQRLSSLRAINIYFETCSRITEKGLSDLGKGLRRTARLRSINLSFLNCRSTISDEAL